ncbi:MAG: hypothetical protein KDB00_21870 [Planctomycetales bacterium]|nr:hypothetical protein [Planctomycetales bacterium]
MNFSLSSLLGLLLLIALGSAYVITLARLRSAEAELERLRRETGYLEPSADDEIAATRLVSAEPMMYQLRIRVPKSPPYRIAYSTLWPESKSGPKWFGAVQVPPGESSVMVRVMKDPRDDRWKIAALRQGTDGTRRMATVLPDDHVKVFRGSHDWLSSGVTQETSTRPGGQSLRLLDERVLVGEGAMMLYGDRPPSQDMVGVFAELQPDVGSI